MHYPYSLLRTQGQTLSRVETSSIAGFRRRAWSKLIRQMLLSDVNIIHRGSNLNPGFEEEDVVGSSFHRTDIVFERLRHARGRVRLVVYYHERLSSELKMKYVPSLRRRSGH